MEKEDNSQRVLIFQGGGALGAYEAGVYKGLYEWLIKIDKKLNRNKPLFHIIAGTSIGAINAAILVSYFKENKTFEGSAEWLIDFWNYLATESSIDKNPFFYNCWDYMSSFNKKISSAESARRYYTTKEFILTGVPNVFKPPKPQFDYKFLDPMNSLFQCDNKPLKKSIEKFANFPIATSFDNNEPRLILLSVDVKEGIPIVFDSYEKEDGTRYSKYLYIRKNPKFNIQEKHEYFINYNEGIKSDFVMASSSYPGNFPYTELEVKERITTINNSPKTNLSQQISQKSQIRKITKYFWDGGILVNTPLKEVLFLHGNYWNRVRKQDIPSLRICIVNLHPINHDSVPFDMDGILDRKNDLLYHDKTEFDELIALLISDYVSLSRYFINLAEKNGISRDLIEILLGQKCRSMQWIENKEITFNDLLKEKATVDFITRIQKKNDPHEIANKIFDFSLRTITKLINDGYNETMEQTPIIEREYLEQLKEIKNQEEEFKRREEEVRKKLLENGRNIQTKI
ncbi:MAG: patatin-like phospholipase family protein [Nitrososphaeraceae archaeon]